MTASTMRAVVARGAGGPEVLQLEQVTVPQPGPGRLRLRVSRCGLNPLDLMARRGAAPWLTPSWPVVLGIEHSGQVDAVGEGVDEGWIGRHVTSTTVFGGNADYSVVPEASVSVRPEGLDADVAAVYRGASHTALRVLELYGPPEGSKRWVLVHSAAGTVGPVATQLAKARGLRVVGVTSSHAKADWARQFGADEIVVATGEDWVDPVRAMTGSAGVALAIDGNGGAAALRNIELLAPLGACVFLGASSGTRAPAFAPRLLIGAATRIAGFNLPVVEQALGDAARVDAEIVGRLRAGTLRMPIGRIATLEDVPELHRALEARELMGRTVIRIHPD